MLSAENEKYSCGSLITNYSKQADLLAQSLIDAGLVSSVVKTKTPSGAVCLQYTYATADKDRIQTGINEILDKQIKQISGVEFDR